MILFQAFCFVPNEDYNNLSFSLVKLTSSFILRCISTHLGGSAVIKILLLLLKVILKCYFNELRSPNYYKVMIELIAIQNNRAWF